MANPTHEYLRRAYPFKRLIICCDGTWQSANHGKKNIPSNIAKLSRAIAKFQKTRDGQTIHQVVFYDAGVGTATDTANTKGWGPNSIVNKLAEGLLGAQGFGLDENVCEAYNFLVNNYNPGDEVYFFGFSRGAYTARAAAGLVARVGLCTNNMMDTFHQMYDQYKLKKAEVHIETTEWGRGIGRKWLESCDKDINIKVVGVFDTVGALGWPVFKRFNFAKHNAAYQFHNVAIHPEIEYAFHALALDEHRRPFSPNLWMLSPDNTGTKKLIQTWFPGVHINLGGGSKDPLLPHKAKGDFEAMANLTFAWMVDRVQENTSLGFDFDALRNIADSYDSSVAAAYAKWNKQTTTSKGEKKRYGGWGIVPVTDSYLGNEATGSLPRSPGNYAEEGKTYEYIHPVVAHAVAATKDYHRKSPGLNGFTRQIDPNGLGHVWKEKPSGIGHLWRKTYFIPSASPPRNFFNSLKQLLKGFYPITVPGTFKTVEIPEFVIPLETDRFYSMERWLIDKELSRARRDQMREGVVDEERLQLDESSRMFLESLDQGNGFPKQKYVYDEESGELDIRVKTSGKDVLRGQAYFKGRMQ